MTIIRPLNLSTQRFNLSYHTLGSDLLDQILDPLKVAGANVTQELARPTLLFSV